MNAEQLTLFAGDTPKTSKIDRIYASWCPPAVTIPNDLEKAVLDAIQRSRQADRANGFSEFIVVYYQDGTYESRLFTKGVEQHG